MIFFLPTTTIFHPETGDLLLKTWVAYGLDYVEETMRDTGIDYLDGKVIALGEARRLRLNGDIKSFMVRKDSCLGTND